MRMKIIISMLFFQFYIHFSIAQTVAPSDPKVTLVEYSKTKWWMGELINASDKDSGFYSFKDLDSVTTNNLKLRTNDGTEVIGIWNRVNIPGKQKGYRIRVPAVNLDKIYIYDSVNSTFQEIWFNGTASYLYGEKFKLTKRK